VQGGDILLLHEDQPHTLQVLPEVLDALRRSGYQLGTLHDMFGTIPCCPLRVEVASPSDSNRLGDQF
jgi:hypothetical protein